MILDDAAKSVLDIVNGEAFKEEGAYNVRYNGQALCHCDTEHVKIRKKEGKINRRMVHACDPSKKSGKRINGILKPIWSIKQNAS